MSQNHFTVSFPLKSAADGKALESQLPPLMPMLYQAADSQGKMHTINVSDQARNLDQVRLGDKVTVEYTEAISLQLKKRGTAAGPPVR